MPIYAFTCGACGPFDLTRRVTESGAPAACPRCGETARRVFTPPGVRRLGAPVRGLLDREDKSAHEPDVVTQKSGRPLPHAHAHAHGHAPPWALSH